MAKTGKQAKKFQAAEATKVGVLKLMPFTKNNGLLISSFRISYLKMRINRLL